MIEVQNLTKRYGNHLAVDNISFTVNEGEIVGFLGPNGAGKSTTMNMITGYLSSTDGSVTIDKFNVLKNPDEAKKRLGYLPEHPPLYLEMTVLEYLNFVCDLKQVKPQEKKKMIADICHSVKITDVQKRIIRNLSKGYRQRVGLAQAMIGYPDVLILDEPTVGLDPMQIIEMRNVIRSLGKQHTIILSSHILPEVSAVCDRVIIINKGKIVASDTTEKLSKRLNEGDKIIVRVKGNDKEIQAAIQKISFISEFEFLGSKEQGTYDVIVSGNAQGDIREALFFAMSEKHIPILMMKSLDLSLEEIFLQLTNSSSGAGLSLVEESTEEKLAEAVPSEEQPSKEDTHDSDH